MPSFPVTLPDELRREWEKDARRRGYKSLSAFVRDMVEVGRAMPESEPKRERSNVTPLRYGGKRSYTPDPKIRPKPKKGDT